MSLHMDYAYKNKHQNVYIERSNNSGDLRNSIGLIVDNFLIDRRISLKNLLAKKRFWCQIFFIAVKTINKRSETIHHLLQMIMERSLKDLMHFNKQVQHLNESEFF